MSYENGYDEGRLERMHNDILEIKNTQGDVAQRVIDCVNDFRKELHTIRQTSIPTKMVYIIIALIFLGNSAKELLGLAFGHPLFPK